MRVSKEGGQNNMYLVTQGKGRINQLGYDSKKSEYVYIHMGKEIWREKGNKDLLIYFNQKRINNECIDDDVNKFEIYKKYVDYCDLYQ